MAQTKSTWKLLLYSVLVGLLLFGLVEIIVGAVGLFLRLEALGFLFLAVLSFAGLVGYGKPSGERMLFLVFTLYLANVALIWYFFSSLYFVLLLLSLVGFLLSVPRKAAKKKQDFKNPLTQEPASQIFEPKENKKETAAEHEEATPKVTHSPGKYVASKQSNRYHEPKCDWAKKIKEERRLWFADKKEAQKKGYRKHECVN